ncbi:CPK20 [Symbiodinium sp. CCMP2592]|nr:CPK20 [Symbiodinium sp. CCMP2592]
MRLPASPVGPVAGSAELASEEMRLLLLRWTELLKAMGSESALFVEASASAHMDFHVQRVAARFAPSTLQRYFDAWLNWVSFCRLAGANHLSPPPGLLPDWLRSQASKQGLSTMQLKALSWFCKTAGLPALKAALLSPVCQAFSVASSPTEHRESLPLSLSFVVWLESLVLDPSASAAEILRVGYLLLCIWGSLRWGDALWVPPRRLHYQPQASALVGTCLRTKTTKRGMPFGILTSGLLGSASASWALRFLSTLSQCAADTMRISPGRSLDFVPATLSGSESRPVMGGPLKRDKMVLWLRGLLLRHWHLHSTSPPPAAFGLVAAHSLKCTLLAWGRQLGSESELRRIQGHHRLSGSDQSVSLYSRDDIIPMLRFQRQLVLALRSGFRPLQPVARGLDEPLPDFPVTLPAPTGLPSDFSLTPDCFPEAAPLPAALPSPPPLAAPDPASVKEEDLVSLSSESSEAPSDEEVPVVAGEAHEAEVEPEPSPMGEPPVVTPWSSAPSSANCGSSAFPSGSAAMPASAAPPRRCSTDGGGPSNPYALWLNPQASDGQILDSLTYYPPELRARLLFLLSALEHRTLVPPGPPFDPRMQRILGSPPPPPSMPSEPTIVRRGRDRGRVLGMHTVQQQSGPPDLCMLPCINPDCDRLCGRPIRGRGHRTHACARCHRLHGY